MSISCDAVETETDRCRPFVHLLNSALQCWEPYDKILGDLGLLATPAEENRPIFQRNNPMRIRSLHRDLNQCLLLGDILWSPDLIGLPLESAMRTHRDMNIAQWAIHAKHHAGKESSDVLDFSEVLMCVEMRKNSGRISTTIPPSWGFKQVLQCITASPVCVESMILPSEPSQVPPSPNSSLLPQTSDYTASTNHFSSQATTEGSEQQPGPVPTPVKARLHSKSVPHPKQSIARTSSSKVNSLPKKRIGEDFPNSPRHKLRRVELEEEAENLPATSAIDRSTIPVAVQSALCAVERFSSSVIVKHVLNMVVVGACRLPRWPCTLDLTSWQTVTCGYGGTIEEAWFNLTV
jgi:hypothetical protein